MTFSSLNPANGTLLRSYEALSAEDVTGKIAAAHEAFLQHGETSLEDRALWMKKLAGILEEEMEELATLLTMETGKTIRFSREEILQCAACCRFHVQHATALATEETVELDANRCVTTWQPMGVLLAVMTGASPFWQVLRFAVPALLGGNAVLLKHASHVPQCAVELELLLRRSGFARGAIQTLLMEDADLELMLSDERIAGAAVTGSGQSARDVAAHATARGKRTVLDSDTANTMIVMPSANLFAAIQAGVAARCVDNGQSSASTARFFVHETVYDEFAMLFAAAMEDVKVGNPLKDETELGPLATEENVSRLKAQVAAALAAGGCTLTGGGRMLGDGNYFEPTVMVNVPSDASFCAEEISGPVALLFKVESVEAAVKAANRMPGGGVSVWTRDEMEQSRIARGLACGSVFLNAPVTVDASLPAGTMSRGGCGPAMAAAALHQFMTAKTVVTSSFLGGDEFNFDLTLSEFEQEAELADPESRGDEIITGALAADEFDVEDDLFVASRTARANMPSRVAEVQDEVAADRAVFAVALLEGPEDVAAEQASAPVIVAEPVARADEGRVAAVGRATPALPASLAEQMAITEESVAGVEAAQPAALSFKDMFERALQAGPRRACRRSRLASRPPQSSVGAD